MSSSEGQLQMPQPSVKSSVVTLQADPRATFSVEFDAMVANWDEYLNLRGNMGAEDDSDDDYHSTTKKGKIKDNVSSTRPPNSEFLRATACTLPENHDFLLANSFDASFGGSGTANLSSSQVGIFGFDDTFDGLDIGEGIGDDIVRELGEGWGASPIKDDPANPLQVQEYLEMDFNIGDLDDCPVGSNPILASEDLRPHTLDNSTRDSHIEPVSPPTPSLTNTTKLVDFQTIVHPSPSPSVDLANGHASKELIQLRDKGYASRKTKRTRPILDVRTELTDEELKATRMYYLDKQSSLRCELELKRFERIQDALIHNMLWDAPDSVHAKELVDFWVNHFKAHVEARSSHFVGPQHPDIKLTGGKHIRSYCPEDGTPRQKRRKVSVTPPPQQFTRHTEDIPMTDAENWRTDQEAVAPMDGSDMIDFNYDMNVNWGEVDDYTPNAKNLRSSEEPGQARHASAPPPAHGDNLGVDVASDAFHSQRSALFPWDMAGGSSSISAHGGRIQLPSNDPTSVEQADVRLRGSSASRRGSSLPSLPNLQACVASPAMSLLATGIQSDDDFVFDVPEGNDAFESRESEVNRPTLERNSYNFLEYIKMQHRSLPTARYLAFNDVVPKTTSTARVAAAALYHCLVLATKDLVQVNQEEPHGRIDIRIK